MEQSASRGAASSQISLPETHLDLLSGFGIHRIDDDVVMYFSGIGVRFDNELVARKVTDSERGQARGLTSAPIFGGFAPNPPGGPFGPTIHREGGSQSE